MLKKGQILSESQFYTVKDVQSNHLIVTDDNGQDIKLSTQYAEKMLQSAHDFTKEEKLNKTEMANKFISSSNIAMTVCFNKQVKPEDVLTEILNTHNTTAPKDAEKEFKKTIKKALEGEERVMIGRHYGSVDELGRVHFVDMEIAKDTTKSYDNRLRQVDPRTIKMLIINNVKYSLK